MSRLPNNALHARLSQIGRDITASFDQSSPIIRSMDGLKTDTTRLDRLEKQVEKLEQAVTTRQDSLDRQLAELEKAVTLLIRRHFHWMPRLMMYGVDAANGAFLPTSPLAQLLIAANYPDVQAIAKATGGRGQKPWQKIHEDLTAVCKSDPNKYSPPPEPAELEAFYEMCVAAK